MPVNQPPTTPEAPSEKPAPNKLDRFRPEMPNIPGVNQGNQDASFPKRAASGGGPDLQPILQIGGIAMVVALLGGAIYWFAMSKHRGASGASTDSDTAAQTAPAPVLPESLPPAQDGPTVAATVAELSKPWSAKKFTYSDPVTHEKTDAMVIRLPGGELWAFSLKGPLGNCELELVTDVASLASKYGFRASHPMVVNPCDRTVYDPMKVGELGGNTFARGEIVRGSALRPPISIDVKVSGNSIVADRIE
jgi:hypothetical protein